MHSEMKADRTARRSPCLMGSLTAVGSNASIRPLGRFFRSAPNNGHHRSSPVGLFRADIVAKVVLRRWSTILRAVGVVFK